ncbi:MAG: hypothetical protein ACK5VI_02690 [Opitutia bacterium]
MKTTTATIASHYLSAIVNNDYSGLDKEETSKLNTWLAMNDLSFCDAINWEGVGFATDEVSGLKADCMKVTWKLA